jgi:ubiquinone/menaquinone biosynthesis C-methylase UbiE
VGYLLLTPLRRLLENPHRLLGGFVKQDMTVLEPGCGMGYFTLPLAGMVGPGGRVIAVDIQPKMIAVLTRRAQKAGLLDRIDARCADGGGLGIADLNQRVDFAAAIHVVHEMPDQPAFFDEIAGALKPGGRLLVIEPKGHVTPRRFEKTAASATRAGLEIDDGFAGIKQRKLLLVKPPSAVDNPESL